MKLSFLFLSNIITSSAIIFTGNSTLAQITPDATLPNNSQVKLQDNIQLIEGGTQAGSNLFHSFKEFSVPTNSTVKFNNAGDIQNILTRVTGETVSNINGLIQASGRANLFLINPNGITFGKNARLDIGGSFIGSTANSIKFADGFEFNAKNSQSTSLLTINVPVGLQLGNNPGNIVNQSQERNNRDETVGLTVPKGRTLALVGGNVSLDGGRLTAPGGQVQLGGLATEGTVDLKIDGNNLSFNFPNNVVRSDVSLDNEGRINTTSDGGGSIAINAGNLNVLGGSQISTGIETDTGAVGSQAGDININATGETQIDGQRTRIENDVNSRATGNSGNLNITTGSLKVTNAAQISASTFGRGNAGNVDVRASNLVELIDSAIFSAVEAGGVGKGGNININAAFLSLKDGAQLITIVRRAEDNQPAGQGDAGDVKIDVTGAVTIAGKKGTPGSGIFSSLGTGAVGNGGNINISSGSLSLSDAAQISASTFGEGSAGNVDVRASDFVELIDSAIFSTVEAGGVGKGGNININAASLSLKDGAQLITIVRRAEDNQPAGQGDAGDVKIDVTGAVTIAGKKGTPGSGIFSSLGTGAVGNGGNINISSGSLSLSDGAQISASTFGRGNAGNVDVRASNLVELIDSNIFSTVRRGAVGNGGNISISSGSLTLSDGAALSASTLGRGNAGDVDVRASNFVELIDSNIFSAVEAGGVGKGGNININAASLSLKDSAQLITSVRRAEDNQPAGQGDAGNVKVDVRGAVTITGVKNGFPSGIRSLLGTGAVGNGGNINISSGSFSLSDGAELAASTFGEGNAGNVDVRASDFVELIDGDIFSTVEAGGVGKGGNININAASLSLKDGSQLQTIVRGAEDNQPAGQGDAGNVDVRASDFVELISSNIFSTVGTGAVGNGGNISISSGSLSLSDGAEITASTYGRGNAGNVDVRASNFVELIGSNIFSAVEAGGVGKGGNININAASLSLKDSAQLITIVRGAENNQPAGQGDAGNVKVDVTGTVTITGVKNGFSSGIRSQLGTGAVGNGGNISISSGSLSLSDGAAISASTFGRGNAENVDVRASNFVELIDGYIFSTVEAGGVGKGGNININAASLSLKDGAQLQTIVRRASDNQPAGQGDAGDVKIDVTGAVTIAGKKGTFPSGIRSQLGTGAVGNGGNINISSGSLSLSDGAQIMASTYGQGNAGNVDVRASNFVELTDSAIFSAVEAGGVGKGENININAASLSLKDGAQLATIVRRAENNQPAGRGDAGNVKVDVTGAVTIIGVKNGFPSGIRSLLDMGAVGNGGNINISSGSLSLSDGAALSASTFGRGNAGNIKIDANDFVNISGRNLTSGFNSSLFVNSSGLGRTGDIEITSPTIRLENNGVLNATSTSGNGGDIILNPTNLLLLSNNSLISATAGTEQQAGDGGNITINSPNGFVVGFPLGNSDIIANAFEGSGGQVKINAFGIFGMQQRNREELQRLNQLDPRKLPTNDITAFSQQNPTLSGIVQINTPDVDPSRGVAELPQYLVNAAGLINQNFCARAYNSSFTITGRGGIAPSPFDVFVGETTWEDWRVNPITTRETAQSQRREEVGKKSLPETPIIEAQGWVVNKKGQVELVASTPNATPHILQNSPNGCLPITRD
jgi:filamentous hemagglutinin family protein